MIKLNSDENPIFIFLVYETKINNETTIFLNCLFNLAQVQFHGYGKFNLNRSPL